MFVIGDVTSRFVSSKGHFSNNVELPHALIPLVAALFDGFFIVGNRSDDALFRFGSRRYVLMFLLPCSAFC